ncbi:hypothetical protein I3F60_21270 [Streptomyces sp. MUM 136J]|uniref:SCO2102 family sporulation regulator n=1 Tax=Streptomyces sp. MUM 136J TaxID=2791992 RepID=UPI001F048420|nr:hypothetical protein [Streptomyces sp. MUM 136J]MCH0571764.1 hypothetical protein [Streptomyces sp. MUM 136J]
MGWTVLYIAFGVVALWLLGEVLLQYKARLRWRLLAFVGFLGVVLGVLVPSVVVIGLGAAAFAVGQTYVTLSFRRGFASGWAVRGRPAEKGRGRRGAAGRKGPALEVSDLRSSGDGHADDDTPDVHGDRDSASYGGDAHGADGYGADYDRGDYDRDDYDQDDVFTPARPAGSGTADAVYQPQPLPEDTGSYGVYGDPAHAAAQPQDEYATAAQGTDQAYGYDGYSGYGQYGYDSSDQQQYAAYSDPYIGTQTYGGASYDGTYGGQGYDQQGYGQDPYATGGQAQTPPGGTWVPQQRTDESYDGEQPAEQPYPYQQGEGQGNGTGYGEQYRF